MVDPAGKRTTANSAKDKFEKINEQLCSILEYCKKLEDNQNELIKMNELANEKIMKLNEKIEELKCEKETTETIENKLNDIEKNVTQGVKTNIEVMEISLTNKLENQEKAVQEKINSYANTVSKNIDENEITKKEISSISNKNYEAISSINKNFETLKIKINQEQENKARMARENNICIFNVPESTDADQEKAKREDVRKLHTILDDKIKLIKDDIKQVYRKNIRDKNKPRPIIITLTSKEKRTELLKLRNLKYEEVVESDEEVGETNDDADKAQDLIKTTMIFISKDRTQLQQEQHRKLVEELKERRGKGEDVTIRNDKIIKNQSFLGVSQLNWE